MRGGWGGGGAPLLGDDDALMVSHSVHAVFSFFFAVGQRRTAVDHPHCCSPWLAPVWEGGRFQRAAWAVQGEVARRRRRRLGERTHNPFFILVAAAGSATAQPHHPPPPL